MSTSQEFGVIAERFVIVPCELLDAAPDGSVVLVYVALSKQCQEVDWLTAEALRKASGESHWGIWQAMNWLEANGWISRELQPGIGESLRIHLAPVRAQGAG